MEQSSNMTDFLLRTIGDVQFATASFFDTSNLRARLWGPVIGFG